MIRVICPTCPDLKCPKRSTCRTDWYFGHILGLGRIEVAIPDPKHSPLEKTAYMGMVN